MISKLGDVPIDPEHPFDGCKLDRKKYAEILTQIVSQYDSCVLAINSEWGTGKTTFIKMWQQHLINNGFNALYFNVWENDFISDPLIGFIGEFKELSKQYNLDTELSKVTNAASKIVLSMLPALVEAIAKQYIGDNAVNIIKGCAQGVTDVLSKEFQDYENQKNSIKEFREALQNFISQCKSDKPLIFFVDELDRCNPAYAVKVLERIKHLFSIPNIVFVLSIDKKQLCNAVKGYYGSESLDAENYLKRFIDIEYNLPEPSYEDFCNYLYDRFEIKTRMKYLGYGKSLNDFAITLFQYNKLSLRQMEKIYSHANLAVSCDKKQKCDPMLFLFFVFLKVCHNEIYTSFEEKIYKEPQDIVDVLEPFLPEDSEESEILSKVLGKTICIFFSHTKPFSVENLKEKAESLSIHKNTAHTISVEIDFFYYSFHGNFTFDKLTEIIDLLINFN
ncbi:hypothetical protein prwr041_04160 [Prevotella herbatica]|uniref:KAP NTPase domain-containing protein n=1 Tax=Prevotella herbatica TaxID=2801997 RepID=A0ABN6EKB7_9BACT|nr:P-loop NTPase fold protein [Prevotella herbatica]BCS84523.1 hypothetical protein prwr041_04160 [Prevotella herbatica]